MKIIYGKTLTQSESSAVRRMADQCGILYDTARLLFCRGIDTEQKLKLFLSPDKRGFHDPLLLSGMKEAAERITEAKERGEEVLIFGDYDADGVSASSVLYFCLNDFGIKARVIIPEREDGYGLNIGLIKELHAQKPIRLLITVDCGISDRDKIERIKELGIDVIVTDHHEPPELLPDCITVDPKISGQAYPFSGLCGAGVAYKLGSALIGERADVYLDYVALATVADSMELVGENRCIVSEGLKIINSKNCRQVIKNLLSESSAGKKVMAHTLAFQIAPRLNAGGRMGDARTALKAFMSDDPSEIFDCCVKLAQYNIARQAECDAIYQSAKIKIREQGLNRYPIILVADDGWRTGFIGIVAARLVEEYNRPAIVFGGVDNGYKGSARSIGNVNIFDALTAVEEYLSGYGGHSQAAGVSVDKDRYDSFRAALYTYFDNNFVADYDEKVLYAEWNCDKKIDIRFAKELEMLEPCGMENRRPLFTATVEGPVISTPLKSGSVHYSFALPAADMLDFAGETDAEILALPIKKTVVFELNYSVFNGRESFKGIVKKVLPDFGDFSAVKPHILRNEILKFKKGQNETVTYAEPATVYGGGAVYAVSDPENLKYYAGAEKLEKYLFRLPARCPSGCILVSPAEVDAAEELVYLDEPARIVSGAEKVSVCKKYSGKKYLWELSTDRADFAAVFSAMLAMNGKRFTDSAAAYSEYRPDFTAEQFIFSAEVFLELGIFKIKNGVLVFDRTVKSMLTNSAIYNGISKEKEL